MEEEEEGGNGLRNLGCFQRAITMKKMLYLLSAYSTLALFPLHETVM